jgi:hypothetical protein
MICPRARGKTRKLDLSKLLVLAVYTWQDNTLRVV